MCVQKGSSTHCATHGLREGGLVRAAALASVPRARCPDAPPHACRCLGGGGGGMCESPHKTDAASQAAETCCVALFVFAARLWLPVGRVKVRPPRSLPTGTQAVTSWDAGHHEEEGGRNCP